MTPSRLSILSLVRRDCDMITSINCEREDEHDGHSRLVVQTKRCSGKTPCGALLHTEHDYEQEVMVWCPGVCLCGLRKHKHGPGEHK